MTMIKPIYNVKRLKIWPMTNETAETYGEAIDLTDRMMSYDDNVSSSTQQFYSDGHVVLVDVDEAQGTLVLGIAGLHGDEFATIFNAQSINVTFNGTDFTVVNESGEEVPPYFCAALMAQTGENTYNLRKWPKVRFQKMSESVQQKTQNRTYSTPTLNGEFIRNERLGIKRSRVTDVNISTTAGAALLNAWFGDADYFGSSGVINKSTFKRSGKITINNGDTLLVGDTITVTNSASGGTAPYTYTATAQKGASGTATDIGTGFTIDSAGTYFLNSSVTDNDDNTSGIVISVTAVAAN